ncbi:Cutinase 1 [Colletotrichum tanaceti]|nr:Cutinase 1 [Colletotrichum tanaceti]
MATGKEPGPHLARYLRELLEAHTVAIQGIEYSVAPVDNACDDDQLCLQRLLREQMEARVLEALRQFIQYMDKCPDALVLASGFSDGAAMLSSVIGDHLEEKYRKRIVGVVTFGNTWQKYNGNEIPNYPSEKTRMYCNKYDPFWKRNREPDDTDYTRTSVLGAEFFGTMIVRTIGYSLPNLKMTDGPRQSTVYGITYRNTFPRQTYETSIHFNTAMDFRNMGRIPKVLKVYAGGIYRVDFVGVKVEGVDSLLGVGRRDSHLEEMTLKKGDYWTKAEICISEEHIGGSSNWRRFEYVIRYFRAESRWGEKVEVGIRNNPCEEYEARDGGFFVGFFGLARNSIDTLGLVEFIPQFNG